MKLTTMTHIEQRQARPGKEAIHSGHFMVSQFEAEAQDDFDDLAVPVPDEEQHTQKVTVVATYTVPGAPVPYTSNRVDSSQHQQLSIETSLTKLFKCMTLAYRQKLTSPKWNRFKGIKLRWKDKIRLNNVIWRCWHMQFIKKQNTLVCQFASPLDVDTHVKPETTILEGKYWKRRAEAVIAEYKKWRMFHIMRLFGKGDTLAQDTISDMDTVESFSQCSDLAGNMLTDEDYLNFMSDTLFSTISSHQPFAFPDPREIARGASLADFIQPSLGPLQPNLDDFMDTLEPLQDIFSVSRLPPVPEESPLAAPDLFRADSFAQPYHDMTAQMTVQGNSNPQLMSGMSEQVVKNEQMQMMESAQLYEPSYAPSYDDHAYKPTRAPYKVLPHQQDVTYTKSLPIQQDYVKFSAAPPAPMPPSATAPATVSLLQAPPAPASGKVARPYAREKSRPRAPYAPPYPAAAYPPPDHYLAAPPERAFKMPSPPLVSPQHGGRVNAVQSKESYRSNSLPLGTQLNADWSLGPRAERSPGRETGALRLRSRSSSSSALGEARRPPPLTSVASDSALPQTRLVLAQLLSTQHGQSCATPSGSATAAAPPGVLKLGEDLDGSPGRSPAREGSSWAEGRSPSPPGSPGSPREPRRTHMHAEQKRRYNIKNGFDTLQALIPHLNNNPAAKVSKAAMLQKGAEYIKQLKAERNQIKQDMENLRQQIECLNNSISNCHALLPATGAPVSRARAGRLREMFARHVADRTLHNWKYWLFSVVAAALVDSFSACVSCGSGADLVRTTLLWAEQHCSLVEMRPAVLNSLRVLCTSTDILTAPDRLPDEARAAAAAAAVKTEPT